jgi:hypothetical protein
MSDTRTRPSVFLKWIGGIALLAASVLIFHYTHPAPTRGIAPTEFDGFVADVRSRQLLRNSLVTVSLGGYSAQQRTDTFGRYSIVFPSSSSDASVATVQVESLGYHSAKNMVSLHPGTNYAEIMLSVNPHMSPAEVSSAPLPGGAPGVRAVSASTERPEVSARAEIVQKKLPSDFMKASAIYAVANK